MISHTFTDDQAIIRRFLALAKSDDWSGSGKLDDLLDDARCYLEAQNAELGASRHQPLLDRHDREI